MLLGALVLVKGQEVRRQDALPPGLHQAHQQTPVAVGDHHRPLDRPQTRRQSEVARREPVHEPLQCALPPRHMDPAPLRVQPAHPDALALIRPVLGTAAQIIIVDVRYIQEGLLVRGLQTHEQNRWRNSPRHHRPFDRPIVRRTITHEIIRLSEFVYYSTVRTSRAGSGRRPAPASHRARRRAPTSRPDHAAGPCPDDSDR